MHSQSIPREHLLLLSELDQAGRRGGVIVPTVEEALGFIRGLSEDEEENA